MHFHVNAKIYHFRQANNNNSPHFSNCAGCLVFIPPVTWAGFDELALTLKGASRQLLSLLRFSGCWFIILWFNACTAHVDQFAEQVKPERSALGGCCAGNENADHPFE